MYLLDKERLLVKEYGENLESKVRERTLRLEINNKKLVEEVEIRKKIESDLEHLLREKEILLRELYHRTKNSLQVVSSMLSLEILRNGIPRLNEILRKTELKIYSMEMVHQKLFESGNISLLNLREYLYDISMYIAQSCSAGKIPVNLVYEMEDVFVTLDSAISCGIIVTELISNSIKHGCRKPETLSIKVSLKEPEKGSVEFSVSDNGCGLERHINFDEIESLGLRTVRELGYHQLKGVVLFESGNGVSCKVTFPNNSV